MAWPKQSFQKYNASQQIGFGSKLERAVYLELLNRQSEGEIKDIKRQQTVVLQEGSREVRITWKLDFSFFSMKFNKTIYCEAKGFETNDYKLKLKIWRHNLPAPLEIWRGNYREGIIEPFLAERVGF
jgi:hypothetical protein